jgi:hypothetical protein
MALMYVKRLFLCKFTWVRRVDLVGGSVHRHVFWTSPVSVVWTTLAHLSIEHVRAHMGLNEVVRAPFDRFTSVVQSVWRQEYDTDVSIL